MFKMVKFRKNHLPVIKSIAKTSSEFNFPDVTTPLFIVRTSVVDVNGNVVAAGFLKLIGEVILVIDKKLLMTQKAEIVDLFYKNGVKAARAKGLDEINAYITDNNSFVNFLLKRMNFVESKADVLVKAI
jgi:hypothetical protein